MAKLVTMAFIEDKGDSKLKEGQLIPEVQT